MALTTSLVPLNNTALQERQTGVLTYETEDRLTEAFADFLSIDVANGDARPDTVRVYKAQVKMWWQWCRENGVRPDIATEANVKLYRKHLIDNGLKHSTISLKLTAVRRFYEAGKRHGLIDANPAEKVQPPRDRAASEESVKSLSCGESERLFMEIPNDGNLKSLRDRAMVALMLLEGLRTVEIVRANVGDIEETSGGKRLLVRGKGKDGYVYPRDDTVKMLENYLQIKGGSCQRGRRQNKCYSTLHICQ